MCNKWQPNVEFLMNGEIKDEGFLSVSKSDINIRFFFTMLRNYIASATLMGIGDIYLSTETIHVFDMVSIPEWFNSLLGGSVMLTGFVLCLINIYQSSLVLKQIKINQFISLLLVTYLSFAGLLVILGVERRLMQALQLALK